MSTTFCTLTPEHEEQIRFYLRFMRAKRDIALQQLDNEFQDIKNDRLMEQMYPQDEVENILDDLSRLVRANVRQEIGALMGMTSILLKQLLEGAEAKGALQLEMNTGAIEDRAVLDAIEKMRTDGPVVPRANAGRLVSIKDEHARLMEERDKADAACKAAQLAVVSDLRERNSHVIRNKVSVKDEHAHLTEERQHTCGAKRPDPPQLQERCQRLQAERILLALALISMSYGLRSLHQERCQRLQAEATAALREKTELQAQFKALQLEAGGKGGGGGGAGAKGEAEEETEDLRRQLVQVQRRLDEEEEEARKRLADSKQFHQLKALLSSKSDQVVALRRRLARYDPNDGDGGDDDGGADGKSADIEDAYGYGHT
ncbi:hypothetical protein JKP88DRAFT_264836 [Tribonema minus]|uniref:Leucine zipper transcription factor-like protein 1 n=1 Tax=Tribonema minus TaxID=303371 RepID=A0A836C9F0_9STRA|nr:hypothetical protein JKP88DRAFT_264836 [Tribonema minus]